MEKYTLLPQSNTTWDKKPEKWSLRVETEFPGLKTPAGELDIEATFEEMVGWYGDGDTKVGKKIIYSQMKTIQDIRRLDKWRKMHTGGKSVRGASDAEILAEAKWKFGEKILVSRKSQAVQVQEALIEEVKKLASVATDEAQKGAIDLMLKAAEAKLATIVAEEAAKAKSAEEEKAKAGK